MRRRVIVTAVAGCCLLIVAVVLLVVVGGGGAILVLLKGTGTMRRASAAREIDKALRVTVEQASRAGAQASDPPYLRHLTCRLRFENVGDRDITSFTGTILFTDEAGWSVFSCGVGDGVPLRAHETAVEEHDLECIGHDPSSGAVDTIGLEKLSSDWLANSLTLADGSKIEVLPT